MRICRLESLMPSICLGLLHLKWHKLERAVFPALGYGEAEIAKYMGEEFVKYLSQE